jgi:type I restriction enzyme S subunit
MGHIKRKHLSDALVAVPPNEILNAANELFNPLFDYLINNKIQYRYLTLIRDSLLPKIISGKIRISKEVKVDSK